MKKIKNFQHAKNNGFLSMKKKDLVIILSIALLLSFTASMVYFSFFKVVKIESSPYYFNVEGKIGLVVDLNAVKFGSIMPGGSGRRGLFLHNEFDFPVRVKISVEGEKSDWITVTENNILIEPSETKEIKIIVNIPSSASMHLNYTGTVTAQYIKS